MLPLRIGQHAIRQLNPSANAMMQRVEPMARVLGNSTTLAIRSRITDSVKLSILRGLATKAAAAKPKAHTGRTTTKRKTTAKKTTTTKTAAKKTTKTSKKPKKKAAAKKPKVKRVKKVLTPEEKLKIRIRELKITALNLPKGLPSSAWSALNSEVSKGANTLTSGVKEASVKYKNLLPEERERYNHIANENKAKNAANYKLWVESYNPNEIRLANNARAQLRRLTKHPRKYSAIKDERQVKRPVNARLLFNKDRWASGDFNGMKLTEVPQLITREWQNLPASQKKTYEDEAAQSKAAYAQERVRVYGENPRPARRRAAKSTTDAASAQVQREAAAASA